MPPPLPLPETRMFVHDATYTDDHAAMAPHALAPKGQRTTNGVVKDGESGGARIHDNGQSNASRTRGMATMSSTGSSDSAGSGVCMLRGGLSCENRNHELPRTASRSLYELRWKFDSLQTRYLQTVLGTSSRSALTRSSSHSSPAVAPSVGPIASVTPSASKLCRERLDAIAYERCQP
eukprot:GEMP01018224.1.p1 GENE.GEMP01018224.1~~GEMP01018224.1.p1  ORF type:complete len:178 (+),score=29.82 GEMP01018224.1:1027-1560(+)